MVEAIDKDERIKELEEELATEREVCLCGCPINDHEIYDDGISCEHEDHECLLTCPAILATAVKLREDVETNKQRELAAVHAANEIADKLTGMEAHASDLDKMLNERTDQRNQHRDELRSMKKKIGECKGCLPGYSCPACSNCTMEDLRGERDGLVEVVKMNNDEANRQTKRIVALRERAEAAEALADRLTERQCPVDEFLPGDEPCDVLVEARKFAEEAVAKHNELLAERGVLRCAFCDAEYIEGTPATQHERLTEHVKVCPKHPMREVEERVAYLERELESWTGDRGGTGEPS